MNNIDNMLSNEEKDKLNSLSKFKKLIFKKKIGQLIVKYQSRLSKAGCDLYLEDKNRPLNDYSENDQKVMLSIKEEMKECILKL